MFQRLLHESLGTADIKIAAAVFVLAVCLPAIVIAGRSITNRFRWLYVAGFCTLPLVEILLLKLQLLNGLLKEGFLATPQMLGTPMFIVLYFLATLLLMCFTFPWLLTLPASTER